MSTNTESGSLYRYPRRLTRTFLRWLARLIFLSLTRFQVIGQENIPVGEPLLVVGNHFHFVDPVAMIRVMPWPLEFIGGFRMPFAPKWITWLPKLWGYHAVQRGTGSREALRNAESVLHRGGVLGIFPEGGSWATVLRPPRPGTAFLAVRTGARILPLGFDGLLDVFPSLRKGRRARVTVRIGKPFGPFQATGQGRERRTQLEEIGHTIMRNIAELIPPERRGHYSDDPAIRAAARGTEVYPWEKSKES